MVKVLLAGALMLCPLLAWLIVRRPVRRMCDEFQFERARQDFRPQRERLEAVFLRELGRSDAAERLRWEDAHWHDEVLWARDRQSHRLLALVEVTFTDEADDAPLVHHATALFEYDRGRWSTEGRRLREISPREAFARVKRLEPVVPQPAQGRTVV